MSEQAPEQQPEFFDSDLDAPREGETLEEFGIRTGKAPAGPPPDPFGEE